MQIGLTVSACSRCSSPGGCLNFWRCCQAHCSCAEQYHCSCAEQYHRSCQRQPPSRVMMAGCQLITNSSDLAAPLQAVATASSSTQAGNGEVQHALCSSG